MRETQTIDTTQQTALEGTTNMRSFSNTRFEEGYIFGGGRTEQVNVLFKRMLEGDNAARKILCTPYGLMINSSTVEAVVERRKVFLSGVYVFYDEVTRIALLNFGIEPQIRLNPEINADGTVDPIYLSQYILEEGNGQNLLPIAAVLKIMKRLGIRPEIAPYAHTEQLTKFAQQVTIGKKQHDI